MSHAGAAECGRSADGVRTECGRSADGVRTETERLQTETERLQTETERLQTATERLQTETERVQTETKRVLHWLRCLLAALLAGCAACWLAFAALGRLGPSCLRRALLSLPKPKGCLAKRP